MSTAPAPRRILLHLDDGRRVPLDPAEIFVLEADGDETIVRTRGRRRLKTGTAAREAVTTRSYIPRSSFIAPKPYPLAASRTG